MRVNTDVVWNEQGISGLSAELPLSSHPLLTEKDVCGFQGWLGIPKLPADCIVIYNPK